MSMFTNEAVFSRNDVYEMQQEIERLREENEYLRGCIKLHDPTLLEVTVDQSGIARSEPRSPADICVKDALCHPDMPEWTPCRACKTQAARERLEMSPDCDERKRDACS